MIDLTNLPQKRKSYGGANGSKISVVYNGEVYMVKLPVHSTLNKDMSYSNAVISEYLGCHIFELLGIKAQETFLGTYVYKGTKRVVVACKDFTYPSSTILDFASVKNRVIDSKSNGYGTDIIDVLTTIEEQDLIDPRLLKEYFWDVFVVDAFIGNWDRHNGNWGFLYNQETDEISISPVFDCGSCLFPQADENKIANQILCHKKEMEYRVYQIPTSALQEDGKRINYYEFITSHKYADCDRAVERIIQRIDFKQIDNLIDSCPVLGESTKKFDKRILRMRKKLILEKCLSTMHCSASTKPNR